MEDTVDLKSARYPCKLHRRRRKLFQAHRRSRSLRHCVHAGVVRGRNSRQRTGSARLDWGRPAGVNLSCLRRRGKPLSSTPVTFTRLAVWAPRGLPSSHSATTALRDTGQPRQGWPSVDAGHSRGSNDMEQRTTCRETDRQKAALQPAEGGLAVVTACHPSSPPLA